MPQTTERNFGFLLTSVYRQYCRLFERQSEGLGLPLAHWRVLSFISRNQGTTQSHVARSTEINSMVLVRILDRMQADGWIERRRDASDRRSYRLYLREAAQPFLDLLGRVSDAARASALAEISADERKVLIDILERVQQRLTKLDNEDENSGSGPPRARIDRGRR